jgi:hypothetical protein
MARPRAAKIPGMRRESGLFDDMRERMPRRLGETDAAVKAFSAYAEPVVPHDWQRPDARSSRRLWRA